MWQAQDVDSKAMLEALHQPLLLELAALWWGDGRRGRPRPHHGAFGRLSIILGVFSGAGEPATMPRPALVACGRQLL